MADRLQPRQEVPQCGEDCQRSTPVYTYKHTTQYTVPTEKGAVRRQSYSRQRYCAVCTTASTTRGMVPSHPVRGGESASVIVVVNKTCRRVLATWRLYARML